VIVVSDTTPLNYLLLIGEAGILHELFNQVYVPPEVMRELQHPRTPDVVRQWARVPPPWVVVKAPAVIDPVTASLDRGEAEAISLAKELKASIVLMDERKGRMVAQREKLTVVRTLALLEVAAEKGLLDLPSTLQKLRATSFRLPEAHIAAALERDAKGKKEKDQKSD
jgi:predicted nucleic acid-binding protein